MRVRVALPALAFVGVTLLAGCSGSSDHGSMNMGGGGMAGSTMAHNDMGSSPTTGSSGTSISVPADAAFNATDVAFAQGMIPHHGQAIQMADMALEVSKTPSIVALATKIKAAQDPEIATMQGWLRGWGQTVPAPDQAMDDHDGMGGMMMSGMMSQAEMAKLGNAAGMDFDKMFLEMMVQHHQGAIEMAKQELAQGKYQAAKDLAQTIVTAQQAEIDEMNKLITANN